MENKTSFIQGEIPRNELELPRLHFVVMDNWIDVIGEKALFSWLKMYTWCDRKNAKNDPSLWNEARIPRSLNKVAKDLKVGKDTFYNKILKPLWNVGLIDLVEYGESESNGNKPLNIVVYKYPQNKFELQVKPLEKIRDYDKDYSSSAKTFALRKREKAKLSEEQMEKIDQLFEKNNDGSETEPPMVPEQNHPWFPNRTTHGSEIEHNNTFNPIINTYNSINNKSNTNNNNLNLNLIDELWKLDTLPMDLRKKIKIKIIEENINLSIQQLYELEHAYHYQIEKGLVVPNASADEDGLSESEFTDTIIKMLSTVRNIKSMRAMVDKWVNEGFVYKFNKIRNLILS